MSRIFKIRCSQISKIMGQMGLTDAQEAKLDELTLRKKGIGKALTENMKTEFDKLFLEKTQPELPQTAKTYLHEWYANDYEQLYTKEVNKGNMVELDLIEFMCDQLQLGVVERNLEQKEDDYIMGKCDVDSAFLNAVIDVKAPWSRTTLHKNIHLMNDDYAQQGKGYCHLWKRDKFILFYGLMDTPPEVNYDEEVIYSDMPANERWLAYQVDADPEFIKQVIERVKLCRIYLEKYDAKVKSKLGQIIKL